MAHWLSSVLASLGLKKIERSSDSPSVVPAAEVQHIRNISDVVYPPRDPGLPVRSSLELLADHQDVIAMLRLHAAESPPRFEARFLDPIKRLAAYINTLPATPSSVFSGAGGLLRACIETAFNAFRGSDGRIFTGSLGVEDRHKLEGRWRYVCFVAGLLYPIGNSLTAMSVLTIGGKKWSPELEALEEWAAKQKVDRVFVTWLGETVAPGPSSVTGTFALHVMGRSNIEWLNEGVSELMGTLLDIVNGSSASAGQGVAPSLVRKTWSSVQEREAGRRYQNYGRLTIGSHVSPYLIDALVGLARTRWKINEVVIFADKTGLYMQWPDAGLSIIRFCREHGYTGIPENEQALLSLLISNGIVVTGIDNAPLHEIAGPGGEIVMGAKIKNPELVLDDNETLESVIGNRQVLMTEVRANDPLAMAEGNKPPKVEGKPKAEPKPPAPSKIKFDEIDPAEVLHRAGPDSEQGSRPTQEKSAVASHTDDGLLTADSEAADDENVCVEEPPVSKHTQESLFAKTEGAKKTIAEPKSVSTAITKAENNDRNIAIVEAPEIRYSELLPEEVSSRLRNVDAELLGRLVHVWRKKAAEGRVMRVCEQGIAFELTLLAEYTTDPVGFLNTLGTNGFLFSERTTPGKMVYQVAATEGSRKTATCFILLHHAAKKLGMP